LVKPVEVRLKARLGLKVEPLDVRIHEMEVVPDHVHRLVESDPTICVADNRQPAEGIPFAPALEQKLRFGQPSCGGEVHRRAKGEVDVLRFQIPAVSGQSAGPFSRRRMEGSLFALPAAKQERDDARFPKPELAAQWKTCHKSISYNDQANQLKAMRANGCLTLSNFSCGRDVLRRVDKAYQAFFARVKRGERPGSFPCYRSVCRYDSITFPSYGDGCRLLDTGKLPIQGAGHVQVKLHRPVEGTIKTVTIQRDVNHWYVLLCRGLFCRRRQLRSESTPVWRASPCGRTEARSTIPCNWSAGRLTCGAASANWRGGNGGAGGGARPHDSGAPQDPESTCRAPP
jgi:hypothetical protein